MEVSTNDKAGQVTGLRKWAPLFVLSLALLIIVLDTTLLNVSFRAIIGDLNTDIESIQWVITAYSLILAAFTITGGRMGDLFGRKKMFMLGAIIFAIGSFTASISKSVGVLILGEAVIEGIGAVLMMPATASLLVSNYKGRDRALAFGVWGGIAAVGAAIGPVFGGWLTSNYTWRWGFRINVVVALILLLGSMIVKEAKDTEEKPTLDFMGILLSSLGLLSMVFGFIKSSDYGWFKAKAPFMLDGHTLSLGSLSIVPVFILIGLGFLFLFYLWEKRCGKKGVTPLVSLKMFKNRQFISGSSLTGFLALGQAGLSFIVPIYLQGVKGLDAFHTGLAMLPMSLALLFAAPFSGFISKYIPPKRIVQAGILLSTIGFFGLRYMIGLDYSQWVLAPGFVLFGLGMGFMMAQVSNITLSAVSVEEAGEASGLNNTFRQVGATLGSAALGAILLTSLVGNISTGISTSNTIPPAFKQNISDAVGKQTTNLEFGGAAQVERSLPSALANDVKQIVNQSTVDAARSTIFYGTGIILIAFLLSFSLPGGLNIEREESAAEGVNTMEISHTESKKEEKETGDVLPPTTEVVDEEGNVVEKKKVKIPGAAILGLVALLVLGGIIFNVVRNRNNSSNTDTSNNLDFNQRTEPGRTLVDQNNPTPTSTPISTPTPTPTPSVLGSNRSAPTSGPSDHATPPPAPVSGYLTDTLGTFRLQMPTGWTFSQNSDTGDILIFLNGKYSSTIRAYYSTGESLSAYAEAMSKDATVSGLANATFSGQPALKYVQNGKNYNLVVYKNSTYWFSDGALNKDFLSKFRFQ